LNKAWGSHFVNSNLIQNTWENNSNATGSTVTVKVDYDFDLLLAGFLGLAPVTLESSSTMVIL
jgi:hypothetical protein